ncbi:hypothetical protein HYE68_001642 [Fusarium pseudograminearum]|nr:hypothetical protein HYE68_001642 [Fusarium pseudograminearum]
MNGYWMRVLSAVFATLFLAAITLKTFYPGNNPHRCRAVQNTGRWIDPVRDEQGNRDPFRQWQPDGCILSQYESENIRRCMEGRKIFLSGDWTSQNVARAMGNMDQEGPELIYISAGAWFTHPHVLKSCNETNATDPWDKRYELFRNHVVSLNKFIGENTPDYDPFTSPMDPYDGISNLILYAPPAGPRYLGDDPAQQADGGRRADEVVEMQQWLQGHEGSLSIPLVWSIPGVVAGQDKIWRDPLRSGFHVKFHVAELRVNILFNMRCNAKLDIMMHYPYSRT